MLNVMLKNEDLFGRTGIPRRSQGFSKKSLQSVNLVTKMFSCPHCCKHPLIAKKRFTPNHFEIEMTTGETPTLS